MCVMCYVMLGPGGVGGGRVPSAIGTQTIRNYHNNTHSHQRNERHFNYDFNVIIYILKKIQARLIMGVEAMN